MWDEKHLNVPLWKPPWWDANQNMSNFYFQFIFYQRIGLLELQNLIQNWIRFFSRSPCAGVFSGVDIYVTVCSQIWKRVFTCPTLWRSQRAGSWTGWLFMFHPSEPSAFHWHQLRRERHNRHVWVLCYCKYFFSCQLPSLPALASHRGADSGWLKGLRAEMFL